MALMMNPLMLTAEDTADHAGCGCAGTCGGCGDGHGDADNGATLGNIAMLGNVGLGDWDQFDPLGSSVPYPTTAQIANPSYSWKDVFQRGALTGFSIMKDIYGGPRQGTYITNGPQGSSYQRLPDGQLSAGFNLGLSPPGAVTGIMPLVLLAVGGIVVLKVLKS